MEESEGETAEVENLPQVAQKREVTKSVKGAGKPKAEKDTSADNETDEANESAEVVSLDQFRKKQ